MSHELNEGTKLKFVMGPMSQDGEQVNFSIGDKPYHCKEIVVSMQCGQMGMVPWAKATLNNGDVLLANLAQMEMVELENSNGE